MKVRIAEIRWVLQFVGIFHVGNDKYWEVQYIHWDMLQIPNLGLKGTWEIIWFTSHTHTLLWGKAQSGQMTNLFKLFYVKTVFFQMWALE